MPLDEYSGCVTRLMATTSRPVSSSNSRRTVSSMLSPGFEQTGGEGEDVIADRHAKLLDHHQPRRLIRHAQDRHDKDGIAGAFGVRLWLARGEHPAAGVAVVLEGGREQVEPFLVGDLFDLL